MSVKEMVFIGPPGTGKTVEIKRAVEALIKPNEAGKARAKPEHIALTSFTRTAAATLAGRVVMPREGIGTLHSFAYRALGLTEDMVADKHIKEFNADCPRFRLSINGNSDLDEGGFGDTSDWHEADVLFSQYQTLRNRLISPDLWPRHVKAFGDAWDGWKAASGLYDFNDFISLALENTSVMPVYFSPSAKAWHGPRVCFADEYQDFTLAERKLLDHWAQQMELIVKVGDDDQTLYSFKGAEPGGLTASQLSDTQRRVLKQSHRVPQAVHALAMRFIQRIKSRESVEYLPTDEPGEVRYSHDLKHQITFQYPERMIEAVEQDLASGLHVGIMASCNYMLYPTVKRLREVGIPFCNSRARKNGRYNPLTPPSGTSASERLLAYLAPTCGNWWSENDLRLWAEFLEAKQTYNKGSKKSVEALSGLETVAWSYLLDHFQRPALAALLGIAESDLEGYGVLPDEAKCAFNFLDPNVLVEYLQTSKRKGFEYPLAVYNARGAQALKPSAEPGRPPYNLEIGTIHSFKGWEFDSVYIFPDLSTKAYSEAVTRGPGYDAAVRMFYVALTRAKQRVTILAPVNAKYSMGIK